MSNRQGRLSLSGLIFNHEMAVFGFLSTSLTASVNEEVCLRVFIGFRYLLRSHIEIPRMNYVRIYMYVCIYVSPGSLILLSLPRFRFPNGFSRFFLHILRTTGNYFWNNFHKLNFVRKINWYGVAILLENFQFNLPLAPPAFLMHSMPRVLS